EETDHTIDRIATACGFGTDVSLRHHFHAALGTTPRNYRATFRG
ncbi:AraC family transcriptional regulator, partial [Kitasatospora sp. NPDC056808]